MAGNLVRGPAERNREGGDGFWGGTGSTICLGFCEGVAENVNEPKTLKHETKK